MEIIEILLITIWIIWIYIIIFNWRNNKKEIEDEYDKKLDEAYNKHTKRYTKEELEEIKKTKIIEENNDEEIEKELKNYNYRVNSIITPRELWFFKYLKDFFKDDQNINIFTKIRLADLISVKGRHTFWEKQGLLNKINRKHIDFVISDTNWKIKCLIELDNWTHNKAKAKINDNFKNEVFESLWIPLLRFKI